MEKPLEGKLNIVPHTTYTNVMEITPQITKTCCAYKHMRLQNTQYAYISFSLKAEGWHLVNFKINQEQAILSRMQNINDDLMTEKKHLKEGFRAKA